METTIVKEVNVFVCSYDEFFCEKAEFPVGIDSYQRPYIWDELKARELLQDLKEYLESGSSVPFYMGSILLHKDEQAGRMFIIDGQQRLTTLSILYYALNGKLVNVEKIALEYDSPISIQNIQRIQHVFSGLQGWDQYTDLFGKIHFTFITTASEDQAFTFFDTQNNRGVRLNPSDLLKAYHLRSVKGEEFQKDCANKWESIQGYDLWNEKDFIAQVLLPSLWRARTWRGQNSLTFEDDGGLLYEFMKRTVQSDADNSVKLYPNSNNVFNARLRLDSNKAYIFEMQAEENGDNKILPFIIRQPINNGMGFFLFIEKYADVMKYLFEDENADSEVLAFRDFYSNVWEKTSVYLRELFVLAAVMYYDQFRSDRLLEFSLRLDHVLGAIRLDKNYIFKVAPLKFLKEMDLNLLDVISQAFRTNEVFEFLELLSREITIYHTEKIVKGKGVQGRYKERLLNYYGRDSFEHKLNWITSEFLKGRYK
ncbi:DUF262 domain-containing protein [Bacillus sp. JJ1609]|uniref:DUF262 domain-containing protein n=1 Tax=Bacillus sp. JJ1609 TaxID=3122977 RepID=UPI0030000D1F